VAGPDFSFERAHWQAGLLRVAGVDEAGAGPLAGPVTAAAVVFEPEDARVVALGIDDSKKLTEAARRALAPEIRARAVAWAVAECSPSEIDRFNIRQACLIAMRRAVDALAPAAQALVIDYRRLPDVSVPQTPITRGDALSLSIGAASILAKTTRDAFMEAADAAFPGYGFARHKGYGTPEHLDALARLGPCPLHRRSYAPVRAAAGLDPVQGTLDV
jgi:ribonuclease HII